MTGLAREVRQDGLITAEQMAQVAAANRTVDDLQGRLTEIAAAIGNTEFSDDNTLTNTLAALQAANTAAGTSYPYSTEVPPALAGLTALTGLWGSRQAGKRKKAETTTAKIIKSIDRAEVGGVVNLSDIKQDRETEDAVTEILAA